MHDKGAPPTVFRFGPFTLDGRSGELRNGPTRLKVPDQSIAILKELLQSPGELVTRETLRDRLWPPDTHVDFEAGLNAAVRRLREALNDSADAPRYVETLPRRGYRFIAAVDGAQEAAAVASAPAAGVNGPVVTPLHGAQGRRVQTVALVTVVTALVAAGVWITHRLSYGAPVASGVGKPVPVTSFPGLEIDPALSPAGNLVAFAWDGEGGDNFDIYVRSLDGRSQVRLTSDAAPDHFPKWSPDGQRIAFVRVLNGRRAIMELPALGGPEQALFEVGPERGDIAHGGGTGASNGLSWTLDGKHLLFADCKTPTAAAALHQYSLEDGQRRQLTRPRAPLGDGHPIVSPDGRYLGFVRMNDSDFGGSVFVLRFGQSQAEQAPVQVTSGHLVRTFDWTADSRSIIHDSRSESGLWRVGVAGGTSEPVLPNVSALSPSVARSGTGVVYQNWLIDSNIWELPTPRSASLDPAGDATFRIIASTHGDNDPQVLTGRASNCLQFVPVGPATTVGRQPRRIRVETVDERRRRLVGKPQLERRRPMDRLRRHPHRDVGALHRRRDRRPHSCAHHRHVQQRPAKLVAGRQMDLLRIGSNRRLADLEDPGRRRHSRAADTRRRLRAGRRPERAQRLLREAGRARHLGDPG